MPTQGPVFGANNDEATVGTFDQQTIDQYYDQEYWDSVGYYDEEGNFIYYEQEEPQEDFLSEGVPEDDELFLSEWNPLPIPAVVNEEAMSLSVWPENNFTVRLKRLDIYQSYAPKAQQASHDPKESHRMRLTPGWAPIRSIFFLDQPVHMTKEILIETGSGPIRRQRFRPHDRSNRRDTSTWIKRGVVHAYVDTVGIPGSMAVYVDHVDTPDRYFLSTNPFPSPSCRRMFRFAGYPATQYFVLGREVEHSLLEAEGGRGTTYIIESGSYVKSRKHWRLISSFWAFDAPLRCTNKYTVYHRYDPFPRMVISLDTFDRIEEWTPTHTFYAWDVSIPGTRGYTLQHIIPSIYSTATHFRRHRLCTVYPSLPWEFRMQLFVFPADVSDCTVDLDGSVAEIVHAAV